ncbi:MAG: AI-2E family transporter [Bacteroidota bacterium]
MRLRLGKTAWLAAAVLALAVFLYLVRSVLVPFILALMLAYLIEPVVAGLQRRGAPRSLAILTIFGVAALLMAVLVAIVVPVLAVELQEASKVIPGYIARLQDTGIRMARLYQRLHLPLNIRMLADRLATQVTGRLERIIAGTIAFFLSILPNSAVLLIVPVIAYYISRDYHRATRAVYQWLQSRARRDILEKFLAVDRVLKAYFRGQALLILIMTGILVAGLSILGLDFAFLLGVLAGVLNIIPYFGPLLGAIPAVLLALTRSPWQAVYVIVLFVLANQLEAALLTPRILGGRVGLHPLLVIFALLAGGKLFGFLGLILAVPVAAAIMVVISEYLREMVTPVPGLTSLGASVMMEAAEEMEPSKTDDGG